jgi:GR25 family glycosyltransferase involved in LPS biosynthesis
MIAVGIITAPRERPTLAQSFASYQAAGFRYLTHIFAEPGSQDVPITANVRVYRNVRRRGNLRNWVWACSQLLMLNEPWLMICEDDIRWARDAASMLENDLLYWSGQDSPGALSLYFPIRMSKVIEQRMNKSQLPNGWHALNLGRKSWGAQCMVLHRAWAEALLQDPVLLEFLADPKWDKNVDWIIAETFMRRGRQIMWRVPCLVEHGLGDGNSSLGYKDRPELRTKYFKGAVA